MWRSKYVSPIWVRSFTVLIMYSHCHEFLCLGEVWKLSFGSPMTHIMSHIAVIKCTYNILCKINKEFSASNGKFSIPTKLATRICYGDFPGPNACVPAVLMSCRRSWQNFWCVHKYPSMFPFIMDWIDFNF